MRGHMVFQKRWIAVLAGILLAGNAVAQQTASAPAVNSADVMAKVNGVPLYRSQLDSITRVSGLPDVDSTRSVIENGMIAGEVVRQAAEKANYGERPEVKQALEAAKAKAISELYLHDNVKPSQISEQQVKARYDEMVAAAGDKEYKPRIISVADDAAAADVLGQLKSGRAFDEVARQYSQASNRTAGGEMEWSSFKTPAREGQTAGIPLPLAQALTQLKAGEYTRTAVAIGSGRVIMKLDAVRPTQLQPYDKVKDQVRQQLEAAEQQKATSVLVAKLIKDAKIER
jgi:peptidyl-prolyl cis-trans isomerase C